jgi:hypothetical protein
MGVVNISADEAKKIIIHENKLFVPKSIISAVGSCISSTYQDVQDEFKILKEKYSSYDKLDEPIVVDYDNDSTIDAYSMAYFPRNTLLPKLLMLSIIEHPFFQDFPKELNILDLGSGTGGVVIGLLDLFRQEPFSKIHLQINACETCKRALTRQLALIKLLNTAKARIYHTTVDFRNLDVYQNSLRKLAPYDIIISGNFLTELSSDTIEQLFTYIPSILSDRGIFLIAEPPRVYTTKLTIKASKQLRDLGLYQFYPCPPEHKCKKERCFMWIDTEFKSPEMTIGDASFDIPTILKTTWVIFSKTKCSIYDIFGNHHGWDFGVVSPYGRESNLTTDLQYEYCSNSGPPTLTHKRKNLLDIYNGKNVLLRGSIVGSAKDDKSKNVCWHPLY